MSRPDHHKTQARLQALRKAYAAELPQRVEALIACWQAAAAAWGGARAPLIRMAHSLAGSAGAFGYQRVGETAKELEEILAELSRQAAVPSAQQKARIAALLGGLKKLAATGPDSREEAEMPHALRGRSDKEPGESRRVVVVESDPALAGDMATQLGMFNWEVKVFAAADQAAAALGELPPVALIVDAVVADAGQVEADAIRRQLPAGGAKAPLVVISSRSDWEVRLAAVRAGADLFLPKPLEYAALAEYLEQVARKRYADVSYRVLIVQENRNLAERHATVLAAAGMDPAVVTHPDEVLAALAEYEPELLLMDLYLGGCSGIEVAQVIRQDPRYLSLPIVFLSTQTGIAQQEKAMRTQADGFLQQPIADTDLVQAVSVRAERFRALAALISQDRLTGLLDHISFKLRLEAEIDRGRRNGRPLCVAMVDIDHFKRVNDTYGHPVGDRVIKSLAHLLRKRLRKTDVIGRYGGEEFIVAMPDTAPDLAGKVIDELREHFGRLHYASAQGDFACTFSAGVAGCPPVNNMEDLVESADRALYEAKRSGRNRVSVFTLIP